jgi:hypothetical protein
MDHDERPPVLASVRFREAAERLKPLDLAARFEQIYRTNLWGSEESVSGMGSALVETRTLLREVPHLLRELGTKTLLDAPCGDFGWLSQADLSGIQYVGADVVQELVDRNEALYGGPDSRRRFMRLDLTADRLPTADVVLCRDCLVHLSFRNIFEVFWRVKESGSQYLLSTTFVECTRNDDIEDGDWRMLNLQLPPFVLPRPIATILEGCTESGGAYNDKALSLWPVEDLPTSPHYGLLP